MYSKLRSYPRKGVNDLPALSYFQLLLMRGITWMGLLSLSLSLHSTQRALYYLPPFPVREEIAGILAALLGTHKVTLWYVWVSHSRQFWGSPAA